MQHNNAKLWGELHEKPRFRPLYPHERVIQFIFNNYPRDHADNFKILDFGCGAGRHIFFLAENGYRTYGSDISAPGIHFTKKTLKDRHLKAAIRNVRTITLPYPSNYFDGCISFGVLYYLSNVELLTIIPELYRILKPGGKLLCVIRSIKDYRRAHGRKLRNGDYSISGDTISRVDNEAGMLMHFFTEKEIKTRFKKFSKIVIDEMYSTYNGKRYIDHDFIVEVTK